MEKKKVFFAIAHDEAESYIASQLSNEIEVVGSTVYKEGVVSGVLNNNPDILVIRETLPGATMNIVDLIYDIKVKCSNALRIVIITRTRHIGDAVLSSLVQMGVHDLVIGDSAKIDEVVERIRKPNTFKDVYMYSPKIKVDENMNKQVFEAPYIPQVIEKEVVREIFIDNTTVSDADKSILSAKELEKIQKEKEELAKQKEDILKEKEEISEERAQFNNEKDEIKRKYEMRESELAKREQELEKLTATKLKEIEDEKNALIQNEKDSMQELLKNEFDELSRLKDEVKQTIDVEKRKIALEKKQELEDIIREETMKNEEKIREIEKSAYLKVQQAQEKYAQMHKETIREIQERAESDKIRLKKEAEETAKLELMKMEESLNEKEEQLTIEKELLKTKYTSSTGSIIAEFNERKLKVEKKTRDNLQVARNDLKNSTNRILELERRNILARTDLAQSEKERLYSKKQSEISNKYKIDLQNLIESSKLACSEELREIEKELIARRNVEEKNLSEEIKKLQKDREEFKNTKAQLLQSLDESKKQIEAEYAEFKKDSNQKLKEKEEELSKKSIALEEKQRQLDSALEEFKAKEARLEKEKQLELEKELAIIKQAEMEKTREIEQDRQSFIAEKQLFEKEKEQIRKDMQKKSAELASAGDVSRNVITFMGCKSGVGSTTVAFNTAVSLAKSDNKVLYVELNKEFAGVAYSYKLGFFDVGIDIALDQLQDNDYENVLKNIISLEDVISATSSKDVMYKNYKKMPKTLEYLFYSEKYYAETRNPESARTFKDFMMLVLTKKHYDYVIFDVNYSRKDEVKDNNVTLDEITSTILQYSSKVYFVISQEISTIGSFLQSLKIMKRAHIPVNEFSFIINRYNHKAELTKKDISLWLGVDIDFIFPDKHIEAINAGYRGLPLALYSRDRDISNALKNITNDITKKSK